MARIDLKVWREALGGMPHIQAARWHGLDLVARWLVASRAAVLVMTILSCIIAGIFAAQVGKFDAFRFVLLCVGLVLAHATNNILNDVSDHQRDVDAVRGQVWIFAHTEHALHILDADLAEILCQQFEHLRLDIHPRTLCPSTR